MPLTAKGKKIKAAMTQQYGAKKGESVFYASINKGNIKGAEKGGGKVAAHQKARSVGMHIHRSEGEENGGGKVRIGGKVMAGGENRAHIGGGYAHAMTDTAAAKSVHPMHHAKGAGSGRW